MTQPEPTWIGTTERTTADGWRVVVHWHDVAGRVVAAGVDVRCYDVPGDAPATDHSPRDGLPDPHHNDGHFPPGREPRDVTSGLMGHRIRWGEEIRVHLPQLVESLDRSSEEDPVDLAWTNDSAVRAGQRAGRASRATDNTYRLVADLHREVSRDPRSRGRQALAVLRLLRDRYHFDLDESDSDRARVRAWVKTARDRGYLPKATNNTKGSTTDEGDSTKEG